jgi:DNA-binding transcriptional ArsR family regulator
MNMIRFRKKAVCVCDLLKSLSHPNRLLILCHLVDGERAVGELAALTGMRNAAASQQLILLRKDGLVKTRRAGRTIYYSLARPDIRALIGFLEKTYCRPQRSLR